MGDAVAQLFRTADQSMLPDSVAKAVRLMMVGAALEVVSGAVAALSHTHKPLVLVSGIVTGLIVAGIWWLVARTCQRGRSVGRVVASIFFVFNTVGLAQTFAGEFHVPAAALVVNILGWIVGLGAVLMLWRHDSSEFFESRRRFPRSGDVG